MSISSFFAIPTSCPGCEESTQKGELCSICDSYLDRISDPCPLCGAPNSLEGPCGQCLQQPPPWDQLTVAFHFSGLSRFLIHQFKYNLDLGAGNALTHSALSALGADVDAIIPVPMHHKKEAEKGFNQAMTIAKQLARQWSLPIFTDVKRVEATPPLEGLTKAERNRTVKGAFALKQTPPVRVVIVDDVYTSGATTAELTRTLKKSGVQFVAVWALARTPLSD